MRAAETEVDKLKKERSHEIVVFSFLSLQNIRGVSCFIAFDITRKIPS